MESYLQNAQLLATEWGLKFIYAAAIFVIGRWLARTLTRLADNAMTRARLDSTLIGFLRNIAYAVLMVFVVLAALNQLGIQTASFIAIVGAAGLAVGLALQGSLSNFAAGVMMIMFRPFKVGDFIEAGGTSGVVEEIMLFNTRMKTGDNREIWVPNNAITGGNIINYSARSTRRVDMVVGVGYSDDLQKVRGVIAEVLASDSRVLAEPAPTIGVSELGESSINFVVRPWVNTADYWAVLFDFNETIKDRFDAEGISIPFPQRDVHLHEVKTRAA